VHYPCEHEMAKRAVKRTLDWAKLSKQAFDPGTKQHLFGIVQGASYKDLRQECAEELVGMDLDGYALGGLAVGEPREITAEMTAFTAALLPEDKPRYLMGVGEPQDILEAVSSGIDMFDCVVPTRNGRNGTAFTSKGRFSVRNASNSRDLGPIEEGCGCYACRNHTRSYIRHLFNTDEILGLKLVSLHNVYFYQKLMREIRQAIKDGKFTEYKNERIGRWNSRQQVQ
ncbi:MAG TPA: tRNA guanosine(34) transglycosylase Tgt, partial [Candidatus Omnitrophota bacterium]|nr:tRNA guanosine(34) transglycosylase Tgt [Candidatus Omnitrophota bacterium]